MLSYYYFYAYCSPYALRLLCFALFPRLSPWQPWQLGTLAKVLPLFYPLGRFERLKAVLMGTNTPHTCIPGLVWQKQARRFSQFELKVGELGFPIHFVCVSAALYHRGTRPPFFPLRWIRSNEPRLYNHVQGDDMRDSNPTFFCCLARVAIPCQVQQPETASPSGSKRSFCPLLFLPLLIEEQRWNLEQQISDVWGTLWPKKLEIYLRQNHVSDRSTPASIVEVVY